MKKEIEIKEYLKYYWLEEYLEKKVRPAFYKNHYLNEEQFFTIIFWKSKRPRKRKRKYLSNEKIVELTSNIYKEQSEEGKLKILLNQHGINIAMASAILSVLYPDDFTVYDINVREIINYPDISTLSLERKVDRYLNEYVPMVRKQSNKLSLRDCDRALWAKYWYQDLERFLIEVKP